jgi:hypothetical protein
VVAKSWRLSQEWLTWSLLAGEDTPKDREKEKGFEKGVERGDNGNGNAAKWKNTEQGSVSF